MDMLNSFSDATKPLMEKLAALFQSYPAIATYYTTVARWIFVFLAIFILVKSIRSLLEAKNPSEIWAYLRLPDNSIKSLSHWENVLGRAASADVHIDIMTVSRNHGTLVRNEDGDWRYNDLGSKGGSMVNGNSVYQSTPVEMGDTITLGGADCVLIPPSLEEKRRNLQIRKRKTKAFSPWSSLIAITVFQFLTCIQFIAAEGAKLPFSVILAFFLFTLVMWGYCIFLRVMRRTAFEMEAIAFFLCTLNLSIVATSAPESIFKQLTAIFLGIGLFTVLCWYLRDLNRALKIRKLLMLLSVALLLFNLIFGSSQFGAVNWVSLGGYNLQPSELVKIAFIFIGSATLDELYEKKNLTMFMGFSVFCLGCLAIM
ncbi:MAG: FtsW/RodA/SpoVE family cell cycle protein, partial [Anaerovoracaceae bacterium]